MREPRLPEEFLKTRSNRGDGLTLVANDHCWITRVADGTQFVANGSVSVRILVQVETDEEKTGEEIQDNIPPKTFGLFGAVHNTVVALQSFPTEREHRRHD